MNNFLLVFTVDSKFIDFSFKSILKMSQSHFHFNLILNLQSNWSVINSSFNLFFTFSTLVLIIQFFAIFTPPLAQELFIIKLVSHLILLKFEIHRHCFNQSLNYYHLRFDRYLSLFKAKPLLRWLVARKFSTRLILLLLFRFTWTIATVFSIQFVIDKD